MQEENNSTNSSAKKRLVIGGALVGTLGILYLGRNKIAQWLKWGFGKPPSLSAPKEPPVIVAPRETQRPKAYTDTGFPLRYGSGGEKVKVIQAALNKVMNAGLVVDGKWGPKTQAAMNKAAAKFPSHITAHEVTKPQYDQLLATYKKMGGQTGSFGVYASTTTVAVNDFEALRFSPGEYVGTLADGRGDVWTVLIDNEPFYVRSTDVTWK